MYSFTERRNRKSCYADGGGKGKRYPWLRQFNHAGRRRPPLPAEVSETFRELLPTPLLVEYNGFTNRLEYHFYIVKSNPFLNLAFVAFYVY